MTTKQVETATVIGTITGTGNASVTITARDMANSPKTLSVAVTDTDTASVVASAIRTALAFDTDVSAAFLVSGAGANVILTAHTALANDSTLNLAIDNGTCTGLIPAPTSTNTTAGDGLINAYCTLAQVKNADVINWGAVPTTAHDVNLTDTINGVSRALENKCDKRFYVVTETRYYTAFDTTIVFPDDMASTSGVLLYTDNDGDGVYENTWTTDDYYLAPTNAAQDGYAYNMVKRKLKGQFTFPTIENGVKLTAPFGFSATTPDIVNRACVMWTNRLWNRYKTPLGVAGSSMIGEIRMAIPNFDGDILELLQPYIALVNP